MSNLGDIEQAIAVLKQGPQTPETKAAIERLERSLAALDTELRQANQRRERHTHAYGEPRLDSDIDDPLGLSDPGY